MSEQQKLKTPTRLQTEESIEPKKLSNKKLKKQEKKIKIRAMSEETEQQKQLKKDVKLQKMSEKQVKKLDELKNFMKNVIDDVLNNVDDLSQWFETSKKEIEQKPKKIKKKTKKTNVEEEEKKEILEKISTMKDPAYSTEAELQKNFLKELQQKKESWNLITPIEKPKKSKKEIDTQ